MDVKNTVVLKSFPNGISVFLDESIAFESLLEEVALKFKEADKFLKDAEVVISLTGRKLSPSQEREVLEAITENSHLRVVCLTGNDEEQKLRFDKLHKNMSGKGQEGFGQFYRGSLKNGQSIETENSIIILGDVTQGCSVYSNKDIIVLGTLSGRAYAGAGGNSSHFVAALNMTPESLRIGDYSLRQKKTWRLGIVKAKNTPMIAYVYKSKINLKPITKELLDDFTGV
jgi:septum site-determining protein MinC